MFCTGKQRCEKVSASCCMFLLKQKQSVAEHACTASDLQYSGMPALILGTNLVWLLSLALRKTSLIVSGSSRGDLRSPSPFFSLGFAVVVFLLKQKQLKRS